VAKAEDGATRKLSYE